MTIPVCSVPTPLLLTKVDPDNNTTYQCVSDSTSNAIAAAAASCAQNQSKGYTFPASNCNVTTVSPQEGESLSSESVYYGCSTKKC